MEPKEVVMIYKHTVKAELKVTLKSSKELDRKQRHTILLLLEQALNQSEVNKPLLFNNAHVQGFCRFHFNDLKDE